MHYRCPIFLLFALHSIPVTISSKTFLILPDTHTTNSQSFSIIGTLTLPASIGILLSGEIRELVLGLRLDLGLGLSLRLSLRLGLGLELGLGLNLRLYLGSAIRLH